MKPSSIAAAALPEAASQRSESVAPPRSGPLTTTMFARPELSALWCLSNGTTSMPSALTAFADLFQQRSSPRSE